MYRTYNIGVLTFALLCSCQQHKTEKAQLANDSLQITEVATLDEPVVVILECPEDVQAAMQEMLDSGDTAGLRRTAEDIRLRVEALNADGLTDSAASYVKVLEAFFPQNPNEQKEPKKNKTK